ncbi:zinc finger, PHD-type containing protein [Tanacetum coccineum]
MEDVRYQLNTSSLQERRTLCRSSMSMWYWLRLVIEKLLPPSGNLHEWVEFRRISLTGFRSCTSRSHYRSVSKQTTRIPDFSVVEFDDRTVMLCDQCEKEYHVGCLRESGRCDLNVSYSLCFHMIT